MTLPTIFFAFFGLPVVDERTAGTGAGDYLLASALWLAGYGVAFLAAAIWAYRREDIRRFG